MTCFSLKPSPLPQSAHLSAKNLPKSVSFKQKIDVNLLLFFFMQTLTIDYRAACRDYSAPIFLLHFSEYAPFSTKRDFLVVIKSKFRHQT